MSQIKRVVNNEIKNTMCEDYPCCGHESGGCPVVSEDGTERFRCACCSVLMPPRATSAVCQPCHKARASGEDFEPYYDNED